LPHREPQYLNTLPASLQLVPLVVRLDYFTHVGAQQLFTGLPIAGIREFSVLALVTNHHTPTKSEIAANAQLELSTVTEVTRRLVQDGLVVEVADPKDRRARRLQITPAGQAVFTQGKIRLEQLSQHLYAPLTATEQAELHRLLSILNTVHSTQAVPGPASEASSK
jgi:DNA-binding MarR family transcriptional regulator